MDPWLERVKKRKHASDEIKKESDKITVLKVIKTEQIIDDIQKYMMETEMS